MPLNLPCRFNEFSYRLFAARYVLSSTGTDSEISRYSPRSLVSSNLCAPRTSSYVPSSKLSSPSRIAMGGRKIRPPKSAALPFLAVVTKQILACPWPRIRAGRRNSVGPFIRAKSGRYASPRISLCPAHRTVKKSGAGSLFLSASDVRPLQPMAER